MLAHALPEGADATLKVNVVNLGLPNRVERQNEVRALGLEMVDLDIFQVMSTFCFG